MSKLQGRMSGGAAVTQSHDLATNCGSGTAEIYGVLPSFLRRPSTHQQVEELIRRGVGVREAAWSLGPAGDASAAGPQIEAIVGWVRSAMGEMRRPYGIDHVALALACRDTSGRILCSNSLGVSRPASFYGPEAGTRVEAFLRDVEQVRNEAEMEVVAALLSLGDLAFELRAERAA